MSTVLLHKTTKYLILLDDNHLKFKSLNDFVCYTLRDIFWNCDEYHCAKANELTLVLIKNKLHNNCIEYTNALEDDFEYIRKLYGFINSINDNAFTFIYRDERLEEEKYIEYNIWNDQLKLLLTTLEKIIIKKTLV